jgi:hypothetical protein
MISYPPYPALYQLPITNAGPDSGFGMMFVRPFVAVNGNLYTAFADTFGDGQPIRISKSTDAGLTWAEVGASALADLDSTAIVARWGNKIVGVYNLFTDANNFYMSVFDCGSDSWTAIAAPTGLATQTGGVGYEGAGIALEADDAGDLHLAWSPTFETISALKYYRVSYSRYHSGSWSAASVVGNQTGVSSDFNAQNFIVGQSGIAHLIAAEYLGKTIQGGGPGITGINLVHSGVVAGSPGAFSTIATDAATRPGGPPFNTVSGKGCAFVESGNKFAFPYPGSAGVDQLRTGTPPDNRIAIGDDSAAPSWTFEQYDATLQNSGWNQGSTGYLQHLVLNAGGKLQAYSLATIGDVNNGVNTSAIVTSTRSAPNTWSRPFICGIFGGLNTIGGTTTDPFALLQCAGVLASEDLSALLAYLVASSGSITTYAAHFYMTPIPSAGAPAVGSLYSAAKR